MDILMKVWTFFCHECITAAGVYDWSHRYDWLHLTEKTVV